MGVPARRAIDLVIESEPRRRGAFFGSLDAPDGDGNDSKTIVAIPVGRPTP